MALDHHGPPPHCCLLPGIMEGERHPPPKEPFGMGIGLVDGIFQNYVVSGVRLRAGGEVTL